MCYSDNFTPAISSQLATCNVCDTYTFSNTVDCIQQMVNHNDQCTGLGSMEETLSYLTLQGWYGTDTQTAPNLLPAADKSQNTLWAQSLHQPHWEKQATLEPLLRQTEHMIEMHVCGLCRSIRLTSCWETLVELEIPMIEQLSHKPSGEKWSPELSGLMYSYDENELPDSNIPILRMCSSITMIISQPNICGRSET